MLLTFLINEKVLYRRLSTTLTLSSIAEAAQTGHQEQALEWDSASPKLSTLKLLE